MRERVAQTRFKLPQEVKEPAISRLDVGADAGAHLHACAGRARSAQTRKFAEDVIRPALEQVDGVAAVNIKGGADREVHVDLDRARLDALGLSPEAIVAALRGGEPHGARRATTTRATREISVRTVGELDRVDAIRELVVATAKDGSAVRLRDVANVEDGFEEMRTRIRANGERRSRFEVLKQSGQNTVAIADAVQARLAELETGLPRGDVHDARSSITSTFIRENAHEVEVAIVFGGAMAILIILVFMLDLRSTIISAFALPTSVIATFFLMYVLGYTLNMMTLLGLSLAIGLLIDDAVVVRENIFKHLERGKPPREAALRRHQGDRAVGARDHAHHRRRVRAGRLHERHRRAVLPPVRPHRLGGRADLALRRLHARPDAVVALLQDHRARRSRSRSRWSSGPSSASSTAWTRSTAHPRLGAAPQADRRRCSRSASLFGMAPGRQAHGQRVRHRRGSRPDRASTSSCPPAPRSTRRAVASPGGRARSCSQDPLIKLVFATIGPGRRGEQVAAWRVITVPKQQRTVGARWPSRTTCAAVAAKVPGAKVNVTDPRVRRGRADRGADHDRRAAATLVRDARAPRRSRSREILRTTPGVQDVQVKYTPGRPELRVEVDRQRAADQGLAVAQVAMALRTAMEGEEAAQAASGQGRGADPRAPAQSDRAGAARSGAHDAELAQGAGRARATSRASPAARARR